MSEEADFTHCGKCGSYTHGPCQCEAVHDDEAPKAKRKPKKADPAHDETPAE